MHPCQSNVSIPNILSDADEASDFLVLFSKRNTVSEVHPEDQKDLRHFTAGPDKLLVGVTDLSLI